MVTTSTYPKSAAIFGNFSTTTTTTPPYHVYPNDVICSQLIGRYSQLSSRHQAQSRRLEESSQLVAQLNRDCRRHEEELRQQLTHSAELRQVTS